MLRPFRGLVFAAILLGTGCIPPPAVSQSVESETKPWYRQFTANAFFSASYTYNFNHPDSQLNQLRVFDFHADKLVFDVGELVVQKPVSKPKDWGIRLDLTAGSDDPEVSASYGLFRHCGDGKAGDVDIHQLFVSYIAPVGSGLRIDFGKFVTPLGFEVIDGYDGYNDNYSRSFLFGYGLPFTHTGIKTSYTFNPKVSAMVMLVQGADVVKDNNSSKSVGAQLALTPSKKWTIYTNYFGGAERKDDNHDLRHTFDVVAVYKATPKLTLSVDSVYGREANAAGPSHDGSWAGGALFGRYNFTEHWALAARGELFNDKDGVRTATVQRLSSFVVTPEYKIPVNVHSFKSTFVVRGDVRFDKSNQNVFQHYAEYKDRQNTVAWNVLYYF